MVSIILTGGLVSATLNAIILGAVFVYSETGQIPQAFDRDLSNHAVKPKGG